MMNKDDMELLELTRDIVLLLSGHGYSIDEIPDKLKDVIGVCKGYNMSRKLEERRTIAEAERILKEGE